MLHLENSVKAPHITSAANLIKETMNYYNVSQTDLAERIGVSQKYISRILNRKEYLNANTALRIENVMGISSRLLLNMDLTFKLHNAKNDYKKANNPSNKFLKKYSWA